MIKWITKWILWIFISQTSGQDILEAPRFLQSEKNDDSKTSGADGGLVNVDLYNKVVGVPDGYKLREAQCAHETLQWDEETPATIETFLSGKTKEECANLCNETADCYSFEFYHDYGAENGVGPGFCQLTRQYEAQCDAIDRLKLTCQGREWNVDLYVKADKSPVQRYVNKKTMCGGAGTILRKTKSFSFDDCAQKCDAFNGCVSFHYMPGEGKMKWVGMCLLTSQTLDQWCQPPESCRRKETPTLYILKTTGNDCEIDESLDPELVEATKKWKMEKEKKKHMSTWEKVMTKMKEKMADKHSIWKYHEKMMKMIVYDNRITKILPEMKAKYESKDIINR